MQDSLIDQSPSMKYRNLNDSVWQSKKGRQQTEKDIELLLNRLQLLKKEETVMHKQLVETKNRTQIVVDKKYKSYMLHELKKNTKKGDDEKLREAQRRNFELKCRQGDERRMIMDAIRQYKREEYEEVKKIQSDNKRTITESKQDQIGQNTMKKDHVKQLLSQSRSKIDLYWSDKLIRIQKEHEQDKIENKQAQSKNELIMGRLEEEEMSLINKLQKSQEVQDQLTRRLDRAINLPHNEFKKMYAVDTDIKFDSHIKEVKKFRQIKQQNKSQIQLGIVRDKNYIQEKDEQYSFLKLEKSPTNGNLDTSAKQITDLTKQSFDQGSGPNEPIQENNPSQQAVVQSQTQIVNMDQEQEKPIIDQENSIQHIQQDQEEEQDYLDKSNENQKQQHQEQEQIKQNEIKQEQQEIHNQKEQTDQVEIQQNEQKHEQQPQEELEKQE